MATTVMQVFDQVVAQYGEHPALKTKVRGKWQTVRWKEYRDLVRQAGRGLMALGLEPGQGVVIIGYNRPEWFVSDLAAIHAGGVPAGIYTTCSQEQCHYIADHAEAAVAVVENAEQLAKFLAVRDRLPGLKAIVMMDGRSDEKDVLSWAELMHKADEVPDMHLDQRVIDQKASDLCTLIYTSGTTGPPKAVMMSHENFTWTAQTLLDYVSERGCSFSGGDSVVSYLPLSHVAEQLLSVHLPMTFGGTCFCLQDIGLLGDTLKEARPALFLGVPRVWEKIQAKIQAIGKESKGLKKKIGAWARKKGLAGGYAQQQGRSRPMLYGLAQKLVFSKVREALGLDRCQMPVTSTAPISQDTLDFFLSFGVPICECYGMSESTGPTTMCTPENYRTGKAGEALPGTGLKLADDGEILMRGPHVFLGYYKNPEATAEALDGDGWLHSGDIGTIDADGYLKVTDRKKELIITAGGKNISPQLIEATLKAVPVVSQVVVIGDRRKFLSALLTLDPERVEETAEAAKAIGVKNGADAAVSQPFIDYLKNEIEAASQSLSRVELIKKFVILPEELTPEGGELTPTMKLKRRVINEVYAEQINSMYR